MIIIETYYLIDYENVHEDGLTGCADLSKTDHITIFFTENAKNIDMTGIADHGDASLEMEKVPAGKQSADLHIVSYLGYLAGKYEKECKVVIVSKDTDFDNVIKFWNAKTKISAFRSPQIKMTKPNTPMVKPLSAAISKKETISGTKKTKLNQEIMQAVRNAGYEASAANTVAQITTGLYGDEHMLREVHNALHKRYTDYLNIYNAIKPVLSKYADNASSIKISSSAPKIKTEINSEIQKLLSKAGYPNEIINYVASAVVKNLDKKNAKQQTYRDIISRYGQSEGLPIYNHVKKHI